MSDRLRRRLTDLVAVPSPTGSEHAAADLVAAWLRDDGADEVDRWDAEMAELEADPAYPGREVERPEVPVVAARATGRRPGPTVVLTGHLDTVGVGDPDRWSRDPFGAEIVGDRLHGRGACDMKAGVVAAVEAFAAIAGGSRDFGGEVRFVGVAGEEDGGTGTLAAIRRGWVGDAVILTEPTSGDVVTAHGGALTFSVDVEGRSAHGSAPGGGVSALDRFIALRPVFDELERAANEGIADRRMTALGLPHATTIGIVRGGTWASNVMETLHAEVRVGVRLDETVAEAATRFSTGLLAGARTADPWFVDHPPRVTLSGARFASSSIAEDHHVVRAVRDAAETVTGRRPDSVGAPYGCDMALWIDAGGCDAVVYGPGDVSAAHAPDEWVSLEQTATVTDVLVDAVGRLLT